MSSASVLASVWPSVSLTSARMIVTCSAFGGSVYAGTIQPRSAASWDGDVELVVVAFAGELERDERELLGAGVADELEVAGLDDPVGERGGIACIVSMM